SDSEGLCLQRGPGRKGHHRPSARGTQSPEDKQGWCRGPGGLALVALSRLTGARSGLTSGPVSGKAVTVRSNSKARLSYLAFCSAGSVSRTPGRNACPGPKLRQ
ncbi:unnamed protein product, partial [Gulo gulo]